MFVAGRIRYTSLISGEELSNKGHREPGVVSSLILDSGAKTVLCVFPHWSHSETMFNCQTISLQEISAANTWIVPGFLNQVICLEQVVPKSLEQELLVIKPDLCTSPCLPLCLRPIGGCVLGEMCAQKCRF